MVDIPAMYNAADALKEEGKIEEAIAKLNELLAADESHTLSHLALAVLYGRVGRHDDAVQHGRRACELEPEEPFSFTAMSVTYQRAWQGTQRPEYIQYAEEAMARAHALEAAG